MYKLSTLHYYLIFSLGLWMVCGLAGCSDESPAKEDVRTELLKQINALRTSGCKCGDTLIAPMKTLTWNTALEDAATNHATEMYVHNYFSYLSIDSTPPIIRTQNAGYDGNYVGEVIARKFYRTKDVIEGWKQSESHCRALMDSLYYEMGGAQVSDYWVVDLGRKK